MKKLEAEDIEVQVRRQIEARKWGLSNLYRKLDDEERHTLDRMIADFAHAKWEDGRGTSQFRLVVCENAVRYLDNTRLHDPVLTQHLAVDLIDSALGAFQESEFQRHVPLPIRLGKEGWSVETRSTWKPFRGVVLGWVLVIFAAVAVWAFYRAGMEWAAVLLGTPTFIISVARYKLFQSLYRELKREARLTAMLEAIRDEVANSHFHPDGIEQRIRRLEEEGVVFSSLTVPILRLRRFPADKPGNDVRLVEISDVI
jgi:hypothetical protein